MPFDVKGALQSAASAALFAAAGATLYETQLVLSRHLPHGATVATSFDGTLVSHHVDRITLVSDDRKPVSIGAGAGAAVIVLGYTRCTDRCPITLAALSRALSGLAPAHRAKAFFVTTDPAYDTPEVLHRYLGAWDNRIAGATGSPGALRALQAELGAGSGAREQHDTRVFLLDASGDVAGELPPDASVAALRDALSAPR